MEEKTWKVPLSAVSPSFFHFPIQFAFTFSLPVSPLPFQLTYLKRCPIFCSFQQQHTLSSSLALCGWSFVKCLSHTFRTREQMKLALWLCFDFFPWRRQLNWLNELSPLLFPSLSTVFPARSLSFFSPCPPSLLALSVSLPLASEILGGGGGGQKILLQLCMNECHIMSRINADFKSVTKLFSKEQFPCN